MNISSGQPCISIYCEHEDTAYHPGASCYWNVSFSSEETVFPKKSDFKWITKVKPNDLFPHNKTSCPNDTVCYSDCMSGNNISQYLFGNGMIAMDDSIDGGLICRLDTKDHCFKSYAADGTNNITSVCKTYFELITNLKVTIEDVSASLPFYFYVMSISLPFFVATFLIYTFIPELKNLPGLLLRSYIPCIFGYFLTLLIIISGLVSPCNFFLRLLTNLLRLCKYAWRNAMVRPWIKCLLAVLFLSAIFYVYLLINVSSVEINNVKTSTKLPGPSINGIDALPFFKHSSKETHRDSNFIQKKCTTVHIAMVCAGYNSTLALVTVVKSVLFYRTKPLHFHLLVDVIARKTLSTLFDTWNLSEVDVSFYAAEEWIPKVSWIPNRHYSGVYGLLKLILPEALKEDKVLVLDTDVTLLTDIFVLWDIFDNFDNEQLVALVENQSDWYIRALSYGQRPWPALGRGFNTGLMLMNLKGLRHKKFFNMWETTARNVLKDIPETTLADQDIINAVIKRYPKIVYILECTWNIQLSDHTISETCYGDAKKIHIIHWNSPRKQEVRNKHADDFRKMHQIFLELDGNLLRRQLFGCAKPKSIYLSDQSDVCSKFAQGSSIIYRTHLFLLEYEYNVYSETDVALVTQCSADRITLLEELCKHWPGTISIALYLTDAEVQMFLEFIRSSEQLKNRKNIAYHIVYKDGEFYPINYLRNIAMSHVSAAYIFQLDIDFLPQVGLYESLLSYIVSLKISVSDKTALIVPAFETQRYRFTFPANKQELIKYLNRGILYTFRYHVWTKGHAATNYTFWRNATQPYEVEWEPDFEPYLVVSRSGPHYDQRFIGFGWNKVSYVTHLTALGYKFIVLPDAFVIHRPHAPSLDIGKFRTNSLYRRCLKKLKDTFVEELVVKYGNEALSKLKKITKDDKMSKTLRLE